MSKHHQHHKTPQANREGTSMPVGTETQQLTAQGVMSDYEEIQRRAYQIHQEKGGSDFENWLEAERILKEEHQVVQR